jgi:hypothetical protein
MSQAPSIIVNCSRTHSNLLQVVAELDGLYLFFLNQPSRDAEPEIVGEGDFIDYETNPEARDIVQITTFVTYWDPDMLWSIASLHEDCAMTPLGHYALYNDNLWASDSIPVGNAPQESVA